MFCIKSPNPQSSSFCSYAGQKSTRGTNQSHSSDLLRAKWSSSHIKEKMHMDWIHFCGGVDQHLYSVYKKLLLLMHEYMFKFQLSAGCFSFSQVSNVWKCSKYCTLVIFFFQFKDIISYLTISGDWTLKQNVTKLYQPKEVWTFHFMSISCLYEKPPTKSHFDQLIKDAVNDLSLYNNMGWTSVLILILPSFWLDAVQLLQGSTFSPL